MQINSNTVSNTLQSSGMDTIPYVSNLNLWGEKVNDKNKLSDFFIIPPFSILNSASKEWLQRKKIWNFRINDKAQVRKNTLSKNGNENSSNTKFMAIKGNTTSILDPVLCEILLHWFSCDNFKSFDPFSGDSVFGFVSAYKKNIFTGIELRKDQVDFNNEIITTICNESKYICDDAVNIDNYFTEKSMDFLFSCPPYADLEIYSELENDLSNMNYSDFFNTIKIVFEKCYKILNDNRFACIVIGEVRHKNTGNYIGLVPKIIQIMCDIGFNYYNEMILSTPIGNLHMRAGMYLNNSRKIGKQHQNVLVFYKGKTNNIKKYFKKLRNGSENME